MKKFTGLFLAALMMTSVVGCRAEETTRTRVTNVPYTTTRSVRRHAPATTETQTTTRRAALPNVTAPLPNAMNRAPLGRTNAAPFTPNATLPGLPAPSLTSPRTNAPANTAPAMPYVNSGLLPNGNTGITRAPGYNVAS